MTRIWIVAALSCVFTMGWDGLARPKSHAHDEPPAAAPTRLHAPPSSDAPFKSAVEPVDPERAALHGRLGALRERMARAQEHAEGTGSDGWYGEQRNPVSRGIEEYGPAYQAAFAELRTAAKNGDPAERARAVRAVSARYPGSYLSLVAELALAEDSLRADQPEQALRAIEEQEQAVAPEIAGNDSVRIQLDLMKGIALAQAGQAASAREHLELAAANPALGPDADHYRNAATAALLQLEDPNQAATPSSR